MNDGFSWWLVVLGIAVGIGLVWLFTVRLPVSDIDLDEAETDEEASWISETIESWGAEAPQPLVHVILDLHRRYLDGDRSMHIAEAGDRLRAAGVLPAELIPIPSTFHPTELLPPPNARSQSTPPPGSYVEVAPQPPPPPLERPVQRPPMEQAAPK